MKQVDEFAAKGLSPPRGKNGFSRWTLFSCIFRLTQMVLRPFWKGENIELREYLPCPKQFGNIYKHFLLLDFHLFRVSSMSPNARMARISSLENMLSISSSSLVAMASQLSEAEERERAFSNRGRWNQLRSMGDAKSLLQYMFNSLADARCVLQSTCTE